MNIDVGFDIGSCCFFCFLFFFSLVLSPLSPFLSYCAIVLFSYSGKRSVVGQAHAFCQSAGGGHRHLGVGGGGGVDLGVRGGLDLGGGVNLGGGVGWI